MALSAISNAKSISEFAVEGLSLAATNISGQEKKNEILCSAAKKGIFLVNHRLTTIVSLCLPGSPLTSKTI